jgi:putative SOS response-associated peptidase YedK
VWPLKNLRRLPINLVTLRDLEGLVPRYNIAPTQDVFTLVQHGPQPKTTFLQWGLISTGAKDPKGMINAWLETIEEKPSFSDSFEKRRCPILADGFYEWDRIGKISQPYYFQMTTAHHSPSREFGIGGSRMDGPPAR